MTHSKHLAARGQGEVDYDFKEDTLFFKVKGREYLKSIEFDDVVVDIDHAGFITGVQIFGASEIFGMDKDALREVRQWEIMTKVEKNIVTLQVRFEVLKRNKIIKQGQSLIRESLSPLADSEVICKVEA